jgi:tRNA A37 threonylcarbamoyladenosine dehydratase
LTEFRYETFTSRNAGYVSENLQRQIRKTRLLVAGCGIGSTIAETCLRLGFQHLTLVDKDQVEAHNLNRQNFTAGDVGTQKVDALAKRLLAINPSASIRAVNDWSRRRTQRR